jgi:predicted ribosome quality control (RQC) complex YloA/Tae2 family protein
MERKRECSSVDVRALAGELREFTGMVVDKAYRYPGDLLRLKCRDFDRGRTELLIEAGTLKRAHVANVSHVPDAPGRPPNFAKMLRNRITGANLVAVSQYEFDRILVFEFEREDQDTTIVAELFGDGNVVVLDGRPERDSAGETAAGDAAGLEVVDCFETVRLKSRTVATGEPYAFPESRVDPFAIDAAAFAERMADSDTDLVRTLATQLNFGGLYAEELCTRADVEKIIDIAEADDDDFEAIYDAVTDLRDRLERADLDPCVYREDGLVIDATPFPLSEYDGLERTDHETFNDALDAYFHEFDPEATTGSDVGDGDASRDPGPDFEAEIAKRQRIVDQQVGAIEDFTEQADAEREKAELLYANYDLVDDVLSAVQRAREDGVDWAQIGETFAEGAEAGVERAEAVEDVDGENGTVTVSIDDRRIALDAHVGVEKNANRLYEEAKRIEEKRDGAEEALAATEAELESLRERQAAAEADGDDEPDREAEGGEAETDWLSMKSIPLRADEQWYERFRWFHTSDDFLVIGGRNADQNEELVEKYLSGGDRFFHAQAHGGPVTILKATGPSEPSRDVDFPESSRRQAAQFAVSYSSVWKDGRFGGDAYAVDPEQVSQTPESGEYLEKGGFAIRGERTYYRDVAVGVSVGITCEPETRVIGGPPDAIEDRVATAIELEPGRYAQNDVAKRLYREFRDRFEDTSFVRKVASPDLIQHFLPAGGSRMVE